MQPTSKRDTIKGFFLGVAATLTVVVLFTLFYAPVLYSISRIYTLLRAPKTVKTLTVPTMKPAADTTWSTKPVVYTSDNFGINEPWLDLYNGKVAYNDWLNVNYNASIAESDLATIQSLGITKIRSWCQMESVFNYKNNQFVLNPRYASNLDDFLNRAEKHHISVICVMGDGHYEGEPQDLDGQLHWKLIQNPAGLAVYMNAYTAYVNRFKRHHNILMWETMNEPYGALTWSESTKQAGVTQEQIHTFLKAAYNTIKPLVGTTPVGFSDYEEEQQPQYQLFSSPAKRKALIDDCTDVYSMHIYRANASQVADFRSLTGKPKWVVELGSYNYDDPKPTEHPLPAHNELYDTDKNFDAVVQISQKLLNSGVSLVMPWAFTSNDGVVKHNPDGTYTLLKLPLFIQDQLHRSAPLSPTAKQ